MRYMNTGGRRPNPYRRAIAMAIDLERSHDALARIVGHSIPLPDRIVPEGSRRGEPRRQRMNLPRNFSLEDMNDVSDRRLAAISNLGELLGPTLGGSSIIDEILEEAHVRTAGEQRFHVETRGPSRQIDPDDRMSADEKLRRDIERAADMPPMPVITVREPLVEEVGSRESITIELFTEGLLDHYHVDRSALHAELMRNRSEMTNPLQTITLVSPRVGSNTSKAIEALGQSFPIATFRLRGLSLDVVSIEFPIAPDVDPYSVWSYHGGRGGDRESSLPTLSRRDGMAGYDVFDMLGRALRDVTGDLRFHDAIVIAATDRIGMATSEPETLIRLRRGYSHIDPPGTGEGRRTRIVRPADVRRTMQARSGDQQDLNWARLIDHLLNERGQIQRRQIRLKEGEGLRLTIADLGSDAIVHGYDIKRDTLDDGEEAIRARMADIIDHLVSHHASNGHSRRQKPRTTKGPVPPVVLVGHGTSNQVRIEGEVATTSNVPQTATEKMQTLFEEADAALWDKAARTDALLMEYLSISHDLEDDRPDLHMQEGVLAVRRMRLSEDMIYTLEKFDRVMGKPTHAVGTIEVGRDLAPSLIEALRDGTARRLTDRWSSIASAQVRKVTRCEGATLVTIRVQLVDKP